MIPDVRSSDRNRLQVDALFSGAEEGAIVEAYGTAGLLDAFGRLRVSTPFTIFDSKQIAHDSSIATSAECFPHAFDNAQVSGAGTASLFNVNRASTTLSVGATTAGRRVRQTKRWMDYQPGKSQRVLLTGVFGQSGEGITKRYGLFNDNNGLFFEEDDGVFYVVRRSYVTGAPVDTRVAQSEWNIDKMDGTGPSGLTLDLDTTNIFYIHFEWLGVGGVAFGLVIDNVIYYTHFMSHANRLTAVYMSTPNLPVRCEIINDGTGAADSIEMICCSVDSEGGINPNGRNRGVGIGTTPITLLTPGTEYALLGIRLRSTHLGVQIDPTSLTTVITSQADVARYRLHINPVVTGTFTWSALANTSVESAASGATPPTITTPGYIMESDYIKTDRTGVVPERLNEKLGSFINGTADRLVLGITPITNSVDILCSMNWRELI